MLLQLEHYTAADTRQCLIQDDQPGARSAASRPRLSRTSARAGQAARSAAATSPLPCCTALCLQHGLGGDDNDCALNDGSSSDRWRHTLLALPQAVHFGSVQLLHPAGQNRPNPSTPPAQLPLLHPLPTHSQRGLPVGVLLRRVCACSQQQADHPQVAHVCRSVQRCGTARLGGCIGVGSQLQQQLYDIRVPLASCVDQRSVARGACRAGVQGREQEVRSVGEGSRPVDAGIPRAAIRLLQRRAGAMTSRRTAHLPHSACMPLPLQPLLRLVTLTAISVIVQRIRVARDQRLDAKQVAGLGRRCRRLGKRHLI